MANRPLDDAPEPPPRRPATVIAAIVLLVPLALAALIPPGSTAAIPAVVLVSGYALAALKLAAAVGLWWSRRWAAILGFVAVLLDALTSVPGLLFAEEAATRALVAVGLALSIAALVLLALPASRRAYA